MFGTVAGDVGLGLGFNVAGITFVTIETNALTFNLEI